MHYYQIDVNPEPWAVGEASAGRRNGGIFARIAPNLQLVAFQEAVRGELEAQSTTLITGPVRLETYFWRRQDDYTSQTSGKRVRKHVADLTNMLKALEDALQDILIDNDRNVVAHHNYVMEQGFDVVPGIILGIEAETVPPRVVLPFEARVLRNAQESQPTVTADRNNWGDDDELL